MEEKRQQEEVEQEGATLTVELANDLLQLLANPSPEVQHGTISAILQYTPTSQSRHMFVPATLVPLLRKYVFSPKLTTISLSALIHFAGEGEFLLEYLPLVEPVGLKLKEWQGLELQLGLLLLLNVSKQEEVIAKIIGDGDKRGYIVQVLYALLERQLALRWIICGIFVNLSTIQRGRKFLVEDKVYARFVPFIISFDQKLREATLKVLRNCVFEWQDEAFANDILKQELNMLTLLARLMTFLLYHRQLVKDQQLVEPLVTRYFGEQEIVAWQQFFKSDKNKALGEVELAIDIVLILSNADMKEKAKGVDRTAFKQLITALKYTNIKEETKDKLEALEIFGL